MKIQFNESSIPQNFIERMAKLDWEFETHVVQQVYQVLFKSMSDFLGFTKSKNEKVAIIINQRGDQFLMGLIVDYIPNEDEDKPGNYLLSATFNKEDISDARIITISDIHFERVALRTAAGDHMRFKETIYMIELFILTAECLKAWLDANAKEGEVVELELPDYFTASVGIENGEKIMSITLHERMKQYVKDNASTEV